jgi:hypothetical protein
MEIAAVRMDTHSPGAGALVRAVFVNEDNHGPEVFAQLKGGHAAICFAAPETFLHNERFLRFFRNEKHRTAIPGVWIDEAQVIPEWMNEFRKSYGQLATLRIILGSQVPFGAASATLATADFEIVFKTLRMGVNRAFWGLDLGTDRPNLRFDVRRMRHPIKSCRDLLSLLPDAPKTPSDLPKTIIYLPDKRSCRVARDVLRAAMPENLRRCFYPFYASHSEDYKATLLRELHSGRKLRFMLSTNAAGMGLDIPDVMQSAVYGARRLSAAFQEGGRAVRDPQLSGAMVWFVPPWMFEEKDTWEDVDDTGSTDDSASDSSIEDSSDEEEAPVPPQESASTQKDRARRAAFDPATIKFVNLAGSETCMRRFALEHCRPRPTLPGFAGGLVQEENSHGVEWEVTAIDEADLPGPGACCSARCCQLEHVETHITKPAESASAPASNKPPKPPSVRCSNAERQKLAEILVAWHDQTWTEAKAASPGIGLLGRSAVLTRNQLNLVIAKAHLVLGADAIDIAFMRNLARAHLPADATIESLVAVLNEFRSAFFIRHPKTKRKKVAVAPQM